MMPLRSNHQPHCQQTHSTPQIPPGRSLCAQGCDLPEHCWQSSIRMLQAPVRHWPSGVTNQAQPLAVSRQQCGQPTGMLPARMRTMIASRLHAPQAPRPGAATMWRRLQVQGILDAWSRVVPPPLPTDERVALMLTEQGAPARHGHSATSTPVRSRSVFQEAQLRVAANVRQLAPRRHDHAPGWLQARPTGTTRHRFPLRPQSRRARASTRSESPRRRDGVPLRPGLGLAAPLQAILQNRDAWVRPTQRRRWSGLVARQHVGRRGVRAPP